MELRHLRYFIALGDVENFRRAAERLHLAQPALSRQIGSLEKELGVKLLDRLAHGTRLSPAGRAFLEDAKRIMGEVDVAAERARRIGRGHVGTLRIGFTEVGSTSGIVPQAIRAFRSICPEVTLDLVSMPSAQQEKALRAKQVDAAFLYRSPESEAEFDFRELRVDEALLAIPQGHPLATDWAPVLRTIANEPIVLVQRSVNPHFHDAVTAAFATVGVTPRIVQETEDATFALVLVSVGLGLSIVSSATRFQLPEGVILRPIRDFELRTCFDLAWRKYDGSPALLSFIDVVTARAKHLATGDGR
jgi:DNA-binding transcriptional LysR family regulator